jgi:hypothetical protein
MNTKHKITIPEPCHEDWNKMTPNDDGRFCGSCSKNVVDFTNMLPDEIQMYLQQHNNVCGRFKNSQLDSLTIQIPNRVLYSQTHYHKMFLLALFIAMGTTLFSCADKNGNKQKIDKVEVVESSANTQNEEINILKKNKTKSNHKPFKEKINQKQYIPVTMGMPILNENELDTINDSINYDRIFSSGILEIKPYPPEGIDKFQQFIRENYIAPDKTKEYTGRIFITFIIEKDGNLSSFRVLRDFGMGSGEEIIRVLKTAPKWVPGKLNNHIVRSSYTLPFLIEAIK